MARKKHKRPHGTGSYQYRDGRHVIQWTAGGKRHTKSFRTQEDALAFRTQACAGLAAERPVARQLSALATIWLDGRASMACNYDDRNRWKNHLEPLLGALKPDEVRVPELKRLIATLRAKGLARGTVGLCVKLLSSLYGDLVEDGEAEMNPVRLLSRKTRVELKSEHDPKKVPFVRDLRDIARIYDHIATYNGWVATAYAIGALAGLRTSEVRALRWEHVDLEQRLIHVQVQLNRRGTGTKILKDKDSRFVPISDSLYWYLRQKTPVFYPDVRDGLVCSFDGQVPVGDYQMRELFADALAKLELPAMRWYEGSRHTFASQWVLNGGSLETLRVMMGHSSVQVTERYAHLIPGRFTDADRARVIVDRPALAVRAN